MIVLITIDPPRVRAQIRQGINGEATVLKVLTVHTLGISGVWCPSAFTDTYGSNLPVETSSLPTPNFTVTALDFTVGL